MGEVNYINPMTVEASFFAESLRDLSATCNLLDVGLIEALENVITTIDQFLESKPCEIVATKNTNLIQCDIKYISRIYYCSRCKRDLGKSSTKVAVHLAEKCNGTPIVGASRIKTGNDSEKTKKEERKDKRQQRKEQQFTQLVTLRKKARSFLSMDQISLYQLLTDSIQTADKLKCIPDYQVIENDLLELTKPLFPNESIKVYKFGSRVSGIGSRESDLDIFIDIGGTFKAYENRASEVTIKKMFKVRDALKSRPKSWKGLVVIDKARVPILKIIHAKSSIECDINFSNSLGHINTLLMEYIFSLQPIARLMCIYMKKWLIRTGLKVEFSTYSMNLMVIFYLQQLNYLPAISKLFQNVDLETALIVGPWLGTYITLTLSDLNMELADSSTLMTFIEGFFKYFLTFDYTNNVVCPYTGTVVKKEELSSVMPNRYTTYVETGSDFGIELMKPMTIQDPIQLDHNVTKRINEFELRVFKELMLKSCQMIKHVKS